MKEPEFINDILSLTNRHQRPTMAARAKRKSLSFVRVIDFLLSDDAGGNFIHVGQLFKLNFLRTCRGLERKRVGRRRRVRFPVLDTKCILRSAGYRLAGDDIFARDRTGADLEPYLPVDIEIAEGEMLALDAVDDPDADMLGVD